MVHYSSQVLESPSGSRSRGVLGYKRGGHLDCPRRLSFHFISPSCRTGLFMVLNISIMSSEKPQAFPNSAANSANGGVGTFLRRLCPTKRFCARKSSQCAPLTFPPRPDPTATADSAQAQPHHVLHFGNVQQYHSRMSQSPPPYSQSYRAPLQVTPYTPQTSLSHGQWTYKLPTDCSMDDGRMRIFEGQITTNIRGVETTMNYDQFLGLDKDDRNALLMAGAPPAPAAHVPPPPPPPVPTSHATTPRTEPAASADEPPEPPKCMSCHLPARLYAMHGMTVCARCAGLDNALSLEHRFERRPSS